MEEKRLERGKEIRFIATLVAVTLIGAIAMTVKAAIAKPTAINSQNVIHVVNPSGNPADDAVFDSEDIYKLYNESLTLITLSE